MCFAGTLFHVLLIGLTDTLQRLEFARTLPSQRGRSGPAAALPPNIAVRKYEVFHSTLFLLLNGILRMDVNVFTPENDERRHRAQATGPAQIHTATIQGPAQIRAATVAAEHFGAGT